MPACNCHRRHGPAFMIVNIILAHPDNTHPLPGVRSKARTAGLGNMMIWLCCPAMMVPMMMMMVVMMTMTSPGQRNILLCAAARQEHSYLDLATQTTRPEGP